MHKTSQYKAEKIDTDKMVHNGQIFCSSLEKFTKWHYKFVIRWHFVKMTNLTWPKIGQRYLILSLYKYFLFFSFFLTAEIFAEKLNE